MKHERLMELAGVEQVVEAVDYHDSGEFTDELHKVEVILKSKRFANWMGFTDDNMDTKCEAKHKALVKAFDALIDELNSPGDKW